VPGRHRFADGSWLGLQGYDHDVPGTTEGFPERDLLAEPEDEIYDYLSSTAFGCKQPAEAT
jgi:hypothetical protein